MKTVKLIVIVILVVILGIIIVQNREPVPTHFLLVSVKMPLILLLIITAGAGFVVGVLSALVIGASKEKQEKEKATSIKNFS
jgi:uncharacterized integral membrane protein